MGQRLQDAIAIITGSDSGIGQATARAMAEEGADIAVTYHTDREGAEKTAEAVRECGRRVVVRRLDQKDPQQVHELFEQVKNELGRPNILVNNAAVDMSETPVSEMSFEQWDNEIRTNLYGPFFCCQEFVRGFEGQNHKHGAIVNITSVHEDMPMKGAAGYDAAKGGLRNLTRTLALEVARKNINVNNIAPGMILTPMNQEAKDDPEKRQQASQSIPQGRPGEPEDIAKAAVFLASEEASYIQGATLVVDGALLFQGGA